MIFVDLPRVKIFVKSGATDIRKQQAGLSAVVQNMMYRDIIVSISQPLIHLIVRGKVGANVEFWSNISVSIVEEFTFLEKLCWNVYNDTGVLNEHIESSKC